MLLGLMTACHAAPAVGQADLVPLAALFGPVISQEVIRGRQDDGERVVLLVGQSTLLHIDLAARRSWRVAIVLAPGEACWGLGRRDDGSLWSLNGRSSLIRIERDGSVSQVVALPEPHLGLFSVAGQLIYQKAAFTSPGAALATGAPDSAVRAPWSAMTTRSFTGIARAQAAALNMVSCGGSRTSDRPCWFPDEAAVSLIAPRGDTRRIALSGLTVVPPEVLLTAENPARPVRDAFVDRHGRIWILSSGAPRAVPSDLPGGLILARYLADGTADGQVQLEQPARLILAVDNERVVVLAGDGRVSGVKSW
jgi:hypothetical protein